MQSVPGVIERGMLSDDKRQDMAKMETHQRTSIRWDRVTHLWEVHDFADFRDMAESELDGFNRLESKVFGSELSGVCFVLWLFPNGQQQHSSLGSIDLSLMCRGEREHALAKWSAWFMDADDNQIPRTFLRDPLKKYMKGGDGRRFSYSPNDMSIQKWCVNGALRMRVQVDVAVELCSSVNADEGGGKNDINLALDVMEYCNGSGAMDVTVVCGDTVFKASRFMLSARSEVLQAMLNGQFKEGKGCDIQLMDMQPNIARHMLDFIHHDRCCLLDRTVTSTSGGSPPSKITIHEVLELFKAADKYIVKCLYAKCLQVLLQSIDDTSVVDVMKFAEQACCESLIRAGEVHLKQSTGWGVWQSVRQHTWSLSSAVPRISLRNRSFSVSSLSRASSDMGDSESNCRTGNIGDGEDGEEEEEEEDVATREGPLSPSCLLCVSSELSSSDPGSTWDCATSGENDKRREWENDAQHPCLGDSPNRRSRNEGPSINDDCKALN